MEYRNKKSKFNSFCEKKDIFIHSLKEVNCFLYEINKIKAIKKIIK